MKVNEIFLSIEGEGKRTGAMAVFIRLHGCNLRCGYCDSMYAVEGKDFKEMDYREVVKKVVAYDVENVTITGGEPLIHKDFDKLVSALRKFHFKINVETNGTRAPSRYWKDLFYTMDWKTKSSGMQQKMKMANVMKLRQTDVLKFVCGNIEDFEKAESITRTLYREKGERMPLVYISPIFGSEITYENMVEIMKNMTALRQHARFQVQLHKIIWDPQKRGV